MSEEIIIKAIENSPVLVASWIIGKPLIEKLLGPTAEYLGETNAQLAKKAVENIGNVFTKAIHKTGDRINTSGQVAPRVLKSIMDNAAYNEDELMSSYYGGVLASSRTGISRDDRGASFSGVISDLSTYQLRAHYVFYAIFFREFGNRNVNPALSSEREKMRILIPYESFFKSMNFVDGEDINAILPHIFGGLTGRSLVDQPYAFGDPDTIRSIFPTVSDNFYGLLYQPSIFGIELFLWAQGQGSIPISMSLMGNVVNGDEEGIILPSDAVNLIQ